MCKYFLLDARWSPTFFGRSLPFLILFIILKNRKNLYLGSFNYFSYATEIGSNWYMDTGVHDLEVAFFKANSTWFNDIYSKDQSNRPIYDALTIASQSGGWDPRHLGASTIGSQLLNGDRSHGWQIKATQPWAPTRKETKQAPVTLIKQWKEKEGQGRGDSLQGVPMFRRNANVWNAD